MGSWLETHLVMVAVEQGEEAGLGAGGALHTTESEIVPRAFDVPQIPKQLLYTSRSTDAL